MNRVTAYTWPALLLCGFLAAPLPPICHAAVTTTGDVSPDPTTSRGDPLYVGKTADGTMTIEDFSIYRTTSFIGYATGATGEVAVKNYSTWSNTDELYVGYSGHGTLALENHAYVTSARGIIAFSPESTGSVTIDGDSSWGTILEELFIGYGGQGAVVLTDFGYIDTGHGPAYIGYLPGSKGSLTAHSSVSNNFQSLFIGYEGGGAMLLGDSGRVSAWSSWIGYSEGSTGRVTVEGEDSLWFSPELFVGLEGIGVLTINDEGEVNTDDLFVNYGRIQADSYIQLNNAALSVKNIVAGHTDIRGAGTIDTRGWLFDQDIHITVPSDAPAQIILNKLPEQNITINISPSSTGAFGVFGADHGAINVSGGIPLESRSGYIGYSSDSVGSVAVSEPGTTWTTDSGLFVGYRGTGDLSISDGGKVTSGNFPRVDAYLGYRPGSAGKVTVDGEGSTWDSQTDLYVGYEGAGTLEITNGGYVFQSRGHLLSGHYLGYSPGSSGRATVDGVNSTWAMRSNFYVGYEGEGEVTISGGARVSTFNGVASIGAKAGGVGRVNVDGADSWFIGYRPLIVGQAGEGVLKITNGGWVQGLESFIGAEEGSIGIVEVDGPGSIWDSGFVNIGGEGRGALSISRGGSVLVRIDLTISPLGSLEVSLSSMTDPFLDIGRDATLDGLLTVGFAPELTLHQGDIFPIIEIGGERTGQFIGLGENDIVVSDGGLDLRISYVGGDGNDVVLNAIPEPGSLLLAAALAILVPARRLR